MIEKLLDWQYWFQLRPGALDPQAGKVALIILGLFVVASFFVKFQAARQKKAIVKKLYKRIASAMNQMGIIGLIWLFFAYEHIYLLGARFWLILWVIGGIAWAIVIYFLSKPDFQGIDLSQQSQNQQKVKEKYLPKSKK